MYSDIPLWLSLVFLVGGFYLLTKSSDAFVDGSAIVARALGISPFIIGMVIIGFGTSAPELCVSALSGMSGHSNLSLGNAYGSCIFNITVVLGVAVVIFPLVVRPAVSFVAGPGLAIISLFSYWILRDGCCSRLDAAILLGAFLVILPAYCWFDQKTKPKGVETADEAKEAPTDRRGLIIAILKVVIGLAVLIGSSHYLVWGAVDVARALGVSELVIGLTIVAIGTSLPELASAIVSAKRGEHEFVLGNIIGSNLFNTLAVVGLANVISPSGDFSPYILSRDLPLMTLVSLSILAFGINWKHPKWPGAINRKEAIVWLVVYVGYTALMLWEETGK